MPSVLPHRFCVAVLLCLGFAATGRDLPAQEAAYERVAEVFASPADDSVRLTLIDLAPPDAPPAEDGAAAEPVLSDYDALLKRIEELETAEAKRTEGEQKKAADEKKKKDDEAAKTLDWTDMSTDKWTVKLGGHVQMDYIDWADSSPSIPGTQNYFEFRRLRLTADGAGYGVYDFRLQMTLEPESVGESPAGTVTTPEVKDAYFSINEIPWIGRLRIGNFFVPFGLEQVTNDTFNVFLERSIPTQGVFTADREVGLAMYNCTPNQRVTWASGVFFDSISEGLKERIDNNQGYRASGRLTWLPYYDEPSNGRYLVHTGIGVLYTEDQNDQVRFRARPQIHEGPRIIDTGVLLADAYTTGNVELAIVMGRVTLQSEYYLDSTNMLTGDSRFFHGGYAHVSCFVTGENRVYERFGQHGAHFGRNQPFSNVFFTPRGCGLGALELKARTSYLNENSVDRGEYYDFTLGFNWYWSDRTRLMFDWIHPMTTSTAVFGQTSSDILGTRFDFNW